MKLVSKKWAELRLNPESIEKYEYLSLRDREAYSILRDYHNNIKASDANQPDQVILQNRQLENARGAQIE